MTVREFLEGARRIRRDIFWINRQIEEIETSLGYHPIQLDDTGARKSNYREDKLSESLSKVADLYADLQARKADLILKNSEIDSAICKLDDTKEREVLRLRYLERHPKKPLAPLGWRKIGDKLGYTGEGARKLHDRAIKNLSTKLKSTES